MAGEVALLPGQSKFCRMATFVAKSALRRPLDKSHLNKPSYGTRYGIWRDIAFRRQIID